MSTDALVRMRHELARASGRPRCLVVIAHRERGLGRVLLEHLAFEVVSIDFRLEEPGVDPGAVDSIWICGFEDTTAAELRALRVRFPRAAALVTRSGPGDGWERRAREAGADVALRWPVSYEQLASILSGRTSVREPMHN